MIVTTTPFVEGHDVDQYIRVVSGDTMLATRAIKDFVASFQNFFGGRTLQYEEDLRDARESALAELVGRAQQFGADAVIGVHMDYAVLGQTGTIILVTATGTAVKLKAKQSS